MTCVFGSSFVYYMSAKRIGSVAKWLRQQTATLWPSVRLRPEPPTWDRGGTGRRNGLKIRRPLRPWGFDSLRSHHSQANLIGSIPSGFFVFIAILLTVYHPKENKAENWFLTLYILYVNEWLKIMLFFDLWTYRNYWSMLRSFILRIIFSSEYHPR